MKETNQAAPALITFEKAYRVQVRYMGNSWKMQEDTVLSLKFENEESRDEAFAHMLTLIQTEGANKVWSNKNYYIVLSGIKTLTKDFF